MKNKVFLRIGQPIQEFDEAMDKAGSVELSSLRKKNECLEKYYGRIAPMFGFHWNYYWD